jgi:hypothetical protein
MQAEANKQKQASRRKQAEANKQRQASRGKQAEAKQGQAGRSKQAK